MTSNANKDLICKGCKAILSSETKIESRNFRGVHGKAILVTNVVNVEAGELVERMMTTGRHIIRDISCRGCNETVGWTYVMADEESEKYKLGKYILEDELLLRVDPGQPQTRSTASQSKL